MKEYRYLFGPVPSRRLGRSLGVDLTPYKTCSFDCVFCQLGGTTRTTLVRDSYVPVRDVTDEIRRWLQSSSRADFITLSGSGEPTLHSGFGDVIEFARQSTVIPVALLTNGTTLHIPEVRAAASRANLVKMSLSAWDQSSMERINRPCAGVLFDRLVEGEKAFSAEFEGQLWMEIFLAEGINAAPEDVLKIAEIVRTIRPDRVQLNTATRPTAEASVVAVGRERLRELAGLFEPEAELMDDFRPCAQAGGAMSRDILNMLRRRPCTGAQIADAFSMHIDDVSEELRVLMERGSVRAEKKGGCEYYAAG